MIAQLALARYADIEHQHGIIRSSLAIAVAEYRLHNLDAARQAATEALIGAESLSVLRSIASARWVLSMIEIVLSRPDDALSHAEIAFDAYKRLSDPWGITEATLLKAQAALLACDLERAAVHLAAAASVPVEDFEPKQHLYLTTSWYHCLTNQHAAAKSALDSAVQTSAGYVCTGDSAGHLLDRLHHFPWPSEQRQVLNHWRERLRSELLK